MDLQSSRISAVQTPVIPEVAELILANPGTISLGQGVVNYGPPPAALERIRQFLDSPENHKYQHVQGVPELREAIADKLKAENGIDLNRRDTIVTAGSNMGFLNAVLAITDPGDEVILLRPYFFNQEMALTMAGARAVVVDTDADYQPVPAAIAAAITPRTRAVVTISPNNPTGAVYDQTTLAEINSLCAVHGIYHISDEAYEHFTYGDDSHFSPAACPESNDHTIALYSLSKGFGFASWRIGYMVVPEHLTAPVKKIQDTNLICPPVVSQYAALACFEAGQDYCRAHVQALNEVRVRVLEKMAELGELMHIPRVDGAFYFLVTVRTELESMTLVRALIERHRVAVIPGSTFGVKDKTCLRIAYGALEPDGVAAGIDRLIGGLRELLG